MLWVARPASAADCPLDERPWISIAFMGDPWSDAVRSEVLAHLRAGLSREGLAVCAEGARADSPVAHVVLSRDSGRTVALTIDVQDGVTQKRLVRNVDLREVPADAETLGIAVATDELLRASWVELALEDAPEPEPSLPPAVQQAVEDTLQPRYRTGPRRLELGIRGVFEHYGGGHDQVGGEGALRAWVSGFLGIEIAFGLRRAFTVEVEQGRVRGSAIGGSASLLWRALGDEPLSLQLELGPSLSQVRLEGDAAEGVAADEGAAIASFLRAGAAVAWRFVPTLGLRARGGAGAPLSSVAARGDGRTVTAVAGLELHAGLEVYAAF